MSSRGHVMNGSYRDLLPPNLHRVGPQHLSRLRALVLPRPHPSASTASSDPRRRLDARLREFMKDGETTDVPSSDLSDTDSDTSDETGTEDEDDEDEGLTMFFRGAGRTSVRAQTF